MNARLRHRTTVTPVAAHSLLARAGGCQHNGVAHYEIWSLEAASRHSRSLKDA